MEKKTKQDLSSTAFVCETSLKLLINQKDDNRRKQ